MKKGAGRKLAYAAVAGFTLGIGGIALSTVLGNKPEQGNIIIDRSARLEAPPPDASAAKVVTDLIEASNALGQIQDKIVSKTTELTELQTLIDRRKAEYDKLEAALDEKGVELGRIINAVRDQDFEALVGLDLDLAKIAQQADGPERVRAAAATTDGAATYTEFSTDIDKIRSIIDDAKAKANPAAAAPANALLVQIIFESGSADLTVGGLTRAMAAAQVISEMDGQVIRIAAFTDTVGSADANERLSRARAESVARVFAEAGVHPSTIEIVAAGEDPTRLPITTADGISEPLNRCVEVYPVTLMN